FETTLAAPRRTIKLDKLEPLTGQENYTIWAATMKHIFKSLKVASIVIDGDTTSANATSSEKAAFEELCEEANTIMIQVVSSDILKMIVTMDSPHQMWLYLREQFYRDTAYSLVSQIMNFVGIVWTWYISFLVFLFAFPFLSWSYFMDGGTI